MNYINNLFQICFLRICLVLVIAANKSDMYELEEVDEEKVKDFAKVIFLRQI